MRISPILEGVCAYLVGYWVVSLFKLPPEKRKRHLLFLAWVVPFGLATWGLNHDWPFALRYCLVCISMFSVMIGFCLKNTPPTRTEILSEIALPLFCLILEAIDFKIQITIPLSR